MNSNQRVTHLISIPIIGCLLISPPCQAAEDEVVRAKIGIEIIKDNNKDSGRKARSRKNSLSPNESLMVHVTPEIDAFVYIVNSNKKGAELLNPNQHLVKKAQTRIFPAANESYQLDGKNEEIISVITSAREQPKIKTLFASGAVSSEKWKQLEVDLLKNKPRLPPKGPPHARIPFAGVAKAGTIRVLKGKTPISIGMDWIVKRYRFNVKK